MGRSNIRQTLLRHLMDRPRPHNRAAYAVALPRLFPTPTVVREFLRTSNAQNRADLAKRFIFHLIHDRSCPPPSRLLMNLLDFEERSAAVGVPDSSKYVGQDHFVHLVNLYLLGVYLYAYHPSLHRRCKLHLLRIQRAASERVRRSSNGDATGERAAALLATYNEYELFAEAWAYFVLYHDLGYPLEATPESEVSKNQTFLTPFNKIQKGLFKDVALKALSNLFALELLLSDDDSIPLSEYLVGQEIYIPWKKCGKDAISCFVSLAGKDGDGAQLDAKGKKELSTRLKAARHYPRLQGQHAIRTLNSVLPEDATVAVLESLDHGSPLLLLLRWEPPASSREDQCAVFSLVPTKNLPRACQSLDAADLVQMAFKTASAPSTDTQWEYFVIDGRQWLDKTARALMGAKTDSYRQLREFVDQKLHAVPGLNLEDADGAETARVIYRYLCTQLGYVDESEPSGSLDLVMGLASDSFAQIAGKFHEVVGRCAADLVRREIEEGKLEPFDLLTKNDSNAVRQLLSEQIRKLAPEIARKFDDRVNPILAQDVSSYRSLRECHSRLRDLAALAEPKVRAADIAPISIAKGKPLSVDVNASPAIANSVKEADEATRKMGFPTYSELAKSYLPPHRKVPAVEPKDAPVIDHGIASGIACLASREQYAAFQVALAAHPGLKAPSDVLMLRLAFGVGSDEEDRTLSLFTNEVLLDAAATVSVHNLYPAALGSRYRGMKSTLQAAPWAFFAMLADALQVWDRERNINQALAELPPVVPSEDFDLQVRGPSIYVALRGERVRIEGAAPKYRAILAEYLGGVEQLIRLSISEGE
jgi:hypothetical protein